LVGWLVGWLVGRSAGCLVTWLFGVFSVYVLNLFLFTTAYEEEYEKEGKDSQEWIFFFFCPLENKREQCFVVSDISLYFISLSVYFPAIRSTEHSGRVFKNPASYLEVPGSILGPETGYPD
jgi:hypothetical protein